MKHKITQEVETRIEPIEDSLKIVKSYKEKMLLGGYRQVLPIVYLRKDQDLLELPESELRVVKSFLERFVSAKESVMRSCYEEKKYVRRGARECESPHEKYFEWETQKKYIKDTGKPVTSLLTKKLAKDVLERFEGDSFTGEEFLTIYDQMHRGQEKYLDELSSEIKK